MKYLAAILLCLAFVFSVSAQTDVISEPEAVVSAAKLNIVYRGVDNPIAVAVPGIACEDLRVTVVNGTATGSGCDHIVRPDTAGKVLAVQVQWTEVDSMRTAERRFRIREAPTPVPAFARHYGTEDTITVAEGHAALGVVAVMFDFDFDIKIVVTHYRLTLMRNCEPYFRGEADEAKLTGSMDAALDRLEPGDIVLLDHIRAQYPSGNSVALGSMRLVVR